MRPVVAWTIFIQWLLKYIRPDFHKETFNNMVSLKCTSCKQNFLPLRTFCCIGIVSTTFRRESRILGVAQKGVATCANSSPGLDCLPVDIGSMDLEVDSCQFSRGMISKPFWFRIYNMQAKFFARTPKNRFFVNIF